MFLFITGFGNSLFPSKSLILYSRATESDSLLLLFKKELPWARHSCSSLQKSNCKQFAPVVNDNTVERWDQFTLFYEWLTLSLQWFTVIQANCSQKTSHSEKKNSTFCMFLTVSSPFINVRPYEGIYFHIFFNSLNCTAIIF